MRKFISILSVKTKVHKLVEKHREELKDIDYIVGMSRGGMIPAAMVAIEMNKPLVAIYGTPTEFFLDRAGWLSEKNILFVDDVCRSGKTMFGAVMYLKSHAVPKDIKVMTIFDITCIPKTSHPQYANKMNEDIQLPWEHAK